jgi:hypothetical protein
LPEERAVPVRLLVPTFSCLQIAFGVELLKPDCAGLLKQRDSVKNGDSHSRRRDLARDPRLSVTLFDLAIPYHTVEIRGVADLIEDPDRALSHRVRHKYLGTDPPVDPQGDRRRIVRLRPEKIITLSA